MALPRPWSRAGELPLSSELPLGREELRERIHLELLCEQQRRRRVLAVHLLAVSGAGLLALLHVPAPERWRSLVEEIWGLLAGTTLLLSALELSARKKLARL